MLFLLFSTINLLTFALTSRGFTFQKDTENPKEFRLMKLIFAINFFVQLAEVYLNKDITPKSAIAIGWSLQITSAVLFWLTRHANKTKPLTLAYHSDSPTHLNRSGPYKFIRHPFYTSYILGFMACSIYSLSPWGAIGSIITYYLYNQAAKFEENKFHQSSLSAEYEKFKKEAGRFLPKLI